MDFSDVNISVGRQSAGGYKPAVTADDVLAVLDKADITDALVWHIAQMDCSPQEGNRLASDIAAASGRLYGCWTILPPQTGEVIQADFFAEMKKHKIIALRAFPQQHNFLLNRTVFGSFMDEIAERGIPLILSLEMGMTWQMIYSILQEYPALTCIICDFGCWSQDRHTWPLLENYPNVYIETSSLSVEAGGIDAMVGKYGAGRLLFGSGFPKRYIEAAVLDVLHADISDSDKTKIASGNLRELIKTALALI